MGRDVELRKALLDLGLEDDIPLWEAVGSAEVRKAVGEGDPIPAVSTILAALARDGAIFVYHGIWSSEPDDPVGIDEAIALVQDRRYYNADTEPNDERVWFVNVGNRL
jgi:hypothetical protein